MNKVNLQSNECVIRKSNKVRHDGFMVSYKHELILTNLNIIYVKKGMFGRTKDIWTFPVNQIKMYEGKPQVLLGKQKDGSPSLEIYFLNRQEIFGFKRKNEVMKWIKSINQLLTEEATSATAGQFAIPGTELVAETIKDTIASFKSILWNKTKDEKVSINCTACGASITGYKGKNVKCNYCDTFQKIQ